MRTILNMVYRQKNWCDFIIILISLNTDALERIEDDVQKSGFPVSCFEHNGLYDADGGNSGKRGSNI